MRQPMRMLLLSLACTTALAQTAQQPAKLRIQTAVPSASIYFELLKRFGDRVDKMSGGRIKMEMLPDGAIVPAFEILDAVDKGIVEGGFAWTHYWSGKHPAAGLFSNPMAGAGSGDRALQRAIIRALGGPPNFLHYAVQRDNLLDLVSLGFGVTLAGGSAMGAFYPGVCVRPLESEAGWLSYCGFWAAENERPALRRFLELRDA